eukprot:g12064.t1
MDAADLAAKKLLLPFINELSLVEIALAERGNPSGGGLASSNTLAKDAIALFQSSYLFREGMDSLGKATGAVWRQGSPGRCPRQDVGSAYHRALESATNGALAPSTSARPGDMSSASSFGKRAGDNVEHDNGSDVSKAESPRRKAGAGDHLQQHGYSNDNRGDICPKQSPESPKALASPVPLHGFVEGQGSPAAAIHAKPGSRGSSGTQLAWSKSSLGNPTMVGVLRRYPQLCESMGVTLEVVGGFVPKHHPPVKTLRLCEEILDEMRKAEEQTAAGGTRAVRNARRAAAAAEARLAACTTEVDKWCLAQAKDLEIREEGERHDNREKRKKRRQRQRQQNRHHESPTTERVGVAPEAASSLRMPSFVATFLSERFGVRVVALQAAVDLLFALETLRPFFPELEHFSLLLRELHDMDALALVLHGRHLVSHLGGLRLRDVRNRVARPLSRPPLRNEMVVIPHPSLPSLAGQVWLTRKGCLVVAFLLLGGAGAGAGAGGGPRSKMLAKEILRDARHVVSSARAACKLDLKPAEEVGTADAPPPPPPPASPPPSSLSSNLTGQATSTPQSACTLGGTPVETSNDNDAASLACSSSVGTDGDKQEEGRERHEGEDLIGTNLSASSAGSGSGGDDGNGQAKTKGPSSKFKPGVGGAPSAAWTKEAYVSVHRLLFLLCDLHMKTPEEILEKAKTSDEGGGLGALIILARAVEQEERREELSAQLAHELKALDILGAEVLRLEGRTRALQESSAGGGGPLGSNGGTGAKDGLAQARVTLALKRAAAKRQEDVVKTMRSEVHLADVQVAASWDDVMSPSSASVPGKNGALACTGSTATTAAGQRTTSTSTSTTTSTSSPGTSLTGRRGGPNGEMGGVNGDSVPAAKLGEVMSFEIEAGDGLTEADAADLTFILRKSVAELGQGREREKALRRKISSSSGSCSGSSTRRQSEARPATCSSSGDGDNSLRSSSTAQGSLVREASTSSWSSSALPQGMPSCSTSLLSQTGEGVAVTAVPGEAPLAVRPSLAARRALRTLRMYVTRLRITKDKEFKAEDIDWREKLKKRRTAAAVVIQRWARRIRKDMTMIFVAKQRASVLRHARDKAKRHALAEEERQVFAAGEVLKRQQMRILQEQEAAENILKGAMMREADQRFWRSRAKRQAPVLWAWRLQVRVEVRFRHIRQRQLRGVLVRWRGWMLTHREGQTAAVKIRVAWVEYRKRCARRETMLALTARHQRIRAIMIQALGRESGDRFAAWKRFTSVSRKVKLLRGGQEQRSLRRRLKRWKAFWDLAKLERHEAATKLQAVARAREAKNRAADLRRERWASTMIGSQARQQQCIQRFSSTSLCTIFVRISVLRFLKLKRRIDRLTIEAEAFRKDRDTAFSIRALRAWQADAHGRGSVRKKIVAMARRRDKRILAAVMFSWSEKASEVARQRQHQEQTEEQVAATRCSAATLIQAVWRSHSTRKGFEGRLREWRSALCIQTRWRGFRIRSTTHSKADAEHGAVSLQRLFRGYRARSRYFSFFLCEASRAASTGRYERLFWLADRWPALIQQEVFSAWEEDGESGTRAGGGGEGILHVACRATAHRCVQLCLQRQADARGVTSAGLTPLHCLALYNARRDGVDGTGAFDGGLSANDDDGSADQSQQSSSSTALLAILPPATVTSTAIEAEARPAESTASPSAEGPATITVGTGGELMPTRVREQEHESAYSSDPSTSRQQQKLLRQYQQQQRKLSMDRSVRRIADLLLDAGAEPDAIDCDGNTSLMTAAATGGAALCKLLLERGANTRATNLFGSSALFLAATGGNPADNSACVRVLLDAGSDPNQTRPDGTTALHMSAKRGHSEVLENLLEHGAQVDAVELSGMTPLMHAVSNDHGGATGLLCDYGADLDLADESGRTALHVASQDGRVNALLELLGRSVDVNATDAAGDSPLHLAALMGKAEAVQALLESGADPNLQNLRGDNAAHVAAREGCLEVVRALVAYDVRIGQRNWQEYTPFGEARMNNHSEVADYLSASFVRLGGKGKCKGISSLESSSTIIGGGTSAESEDVELQPEHGGKAGWDREMEEKTEGWAKEWDEERQRFYYVNLETLEATYTAPFTISADRVEELREGAEVGYRRNVAVVKGESLLGLSDYREAFQDEKLELDAHKLKQEAATIIQSGWRVLMATQRANHIRVQHRSARKIQRGFRRLVGKRWRQRWAALTNACLVVQKVHRGVRLRRKFQNEEDELHRLKSARVLSRLLGRVYRGHLYGRKVARKMRAQREAVWWGPSEWEAALFNAGAPVRTFYGWTGHWEAYLLQDSVDVIFYRNVDSTEYTWDLPSEWREQEAYEFYEREHARKYGFTAAEARAATALQKAWRGKAARTQFQLIMRAQRICKGAEAAYLADPDSLRCQINYILYTHVIEKDYNRARILYTTALNAMESRGPDVQLLLFAFAIFCLVTREEDMVSILATVERGIAAGAEVTATTDNPWPAESYTSKRNPRQFALAEAGFFRFAAYNINDSESWHNYAVCRQLAYGDYAGASECYLKAIEINPKDSRLQANYQALMDTFPEDSQGSSTFESLTSHHKKQAESDKRQQSTASAKFLQRPEVKQAVLKIERAYLSSRQGQIQKFGSYLGLTGMLLREVQGDVLALQREQQASALGSTSRSQEQQQHQPSTLALPSPPGSVSGSSTRRPDSLLQLRSASSSLSDYSGNRASGGAYDPTRWEMSSEDPDPANVGSGTMPKGCGTASKGFEDTDAAPNTHGAVFGPSLSSSLVSLGWEIVNDDGVEFYYNGNTGESRWDPPRPDAADTAARPSGTCSMGDEERPLPGGGERNGDCGAEAAGGAEGTPLDDSDSLKPPDALPAGWEAVAVEDGDGDGGVYYHHVASGLTQWEVPHGEEGAGDEAIGDISGRAVWEEFKTEEGVPFWYKAGTGESCWEFPVNSSE